ncbi:MAG TPA: MBL fold metallo-hydrolase [Vicinamibacterales bacterium]|nr:MBL fold metallo-hydrolase [Vicinamibacterales bacterium]
MSSLRSVRIALAAFAGVALAAPVFAQAPAQQPFQVHQLKPDVYWVEGGGGNSGVIIGDKGVIIVDAKTTEAGGKELLAAVAKLTPKPVTTLIETHSDGDHVNGAAAFPKGITIIAHQNDKAEQETALKAGGRGAPPAEHLPTKTVNKDKEKMKIDGVELELLHWAPAHTSGDLVVFLPKEKIVFTGDIVATQLPDPLIHLEKNGSSLGWLTTARGIAALDADQFVPGHGDVQNKGQIYDRLEKAQAKRDKIASMVKDGKSLTDIQAAVDTPAPAGRAGGAGAGRGGRGPQFASFTQVVYQELTRK